MRPHLVRLNSTITAPAQFFFTAALTFELFLFLIFAIGGPLLCIAVWRIRCIHRNFRLQICIAVAIYFIVIAARSVLIVYQIWDIPVTDSDPILLAAEILRDSVIGYYCGLACSMVLQTLLATYYWQWYEKGSRSTLCVLLFSESTNISFAVVNASIWLLGYVQFVHNFIYLSVIETIGVLLFIFTYLKNDRELQMMSKDKIAYGNYRVDRSFQVRENVRYMKYIVHSIVPAALIASPCYVCFAFHEYGPSDWLLARSIAYALWDLLYAVFRVIYLYLEIRAHPHIWRAFKNLRFLRKLPRRRKMTISDESVARSPRNDFEMTQSYFNQFKSAWG